MRKGLDRIQVGLLNVFELLERPWTVVEVLCGPNLASEESTARFATGSSSRGLERYGPCHVVTRALVSYDVIFMSFSMFQVLGIFVPCLVQAVVAAILLWKTSRRSLSFCMSKLLGFLGVSALTCKHM